MESRAPYALIGLFMTAALVAVFGFVFWLHNSAGLQARATYRVQFENTVAGLVDGAPVLFNGIRVGEVTGLQLSNDVPGRVIATIAVLASAPIRLDTKVGLDFQGLTGVPVIALQGGGADAAKFPAGQVALLVADPQVGVSVGQAAREALLRLDTILKENAEPLKVAVAGISSFSAALARNSERIDSIFAGLLKMTGGGDQTPPESYDLTAAPPIAQVSQNAPKDSQNASKTESDKARDPLVVAEPTVLIAMDTQKILVRTDNHTSPGFGKAQWRDNAPKFLQAKIIQSFENAGFLGRVSKPVDGAPPSQQLSTDLRSFEIVSERSEADVEFTAKLMSSKGRVIAARLFHATAPASATDVKLAVKGFDDAFGKTERELVSWAADALRRP
jgi:phospholipid/cholesterol/gamma-HCH transport system substrate-binding protein